MWRKLEDFPMDEYIERMDELPEDFRCTECDHPFHVDEMSEMLNVCKQCYGG